MKRFPPEDLTDRPVAAQCGSEMEIYLGSGITHASERSVLEAVARIVAALGEPSLVLANVHLGRRQIDVVVCSEMRVIVLEAKGYTRPIRGDLNGPWYVELSTGAWKETENAYIQALDAKNAVRDAMRAFASDPEPAYPAAAVVFVPEIPPHSELTSGDFKVSVAGLRSLAMLIQSAPVNSWRLDQWRAFAQTHHLSRVSTVATACDDRMRAEELLLTSYSVEFSRTYGSDAERLISCGCKSGCEDLSSADFVRDIAERGANALLGGPSGCGKSLIALSAAVAALGNRLIPVMVAAKHYETSIKSVLDREIAMLVSCSAIELFAAARRHGRRVLLVVDGYNECPKDRRPALTRCIAALARRLECDVLITSQIPVARAELLPLRQIDVTLPAADVKRAIAQQGRNGWSLAAHLEALLDAVTSGLEARLVGEVGQDLGSSSVSRHDLFDAFARSRLSDVASEGISALASIAEWLYEHVTFSVSVRELDRLAQSGQLSSSILQTLIEKGLLHSRAGRISFSHEMFFNAFAAESVVRRSAGTAFGIIQAFHDPQHADRRDLIVGAVDELDVLTEILQHIPDAALVASCLSGACGRFAREWVEARYPQTLTRMRDEVTRVHCSLTPESAWGVSIASESPMSPEGPDGALVQHLPDLVSTGIYLRDVLELAAMLDQRLAHECSRLREQARQQRLGTKTATFAEAYVLANSESLALTRVCVRLHSELFHVKGELVKEIALLASTDNLTPGQLYILMSLCRHVERGTDDSVLIRIVAEAIERYGDGAPYHLQLALVEAARHCAIVNDEPDKRLIEALESMLDDRNIGVNSLIFDVLQQIGAFAVEAREMEPEIRQTIEELVRKADDPECCAEADRVYNAQFDGPYSDAYWEVVRGLPAERRKTFLEMAAKGAEYAGLFLPLVLIDLAAFDDPRTEAAFRRWAKAPPGNSFMPQTAIEAFVLAHVALARLRIALPSYDANSAAESALHACGHLLYWANRLDVTDDVKERATHKAWTTLTSNGVHHHAMNVISSCSSTMIRNTDKLPGGLTARMSIALQYPEESAEICRRSLGHPDTQAGYFQFYREHDRREDQVFALGVVAEHGQSTDLPLLRRLAQSLEFGREALKAIRRLEQRLSTSATSLGASTT